MDFNEIKRGLERLACLAEGWERSGVSELERDIALEELRKIYSAIRFAADDKTVPQALQSDNRENAAVPEVADAEPEIAVASDSEAAVGDLETAVGEELVEDEILIEEPVAEIVAVESAADEKPVETGEPTAVGETAADNAERNTAPETAPQIASASYKNEHRNNGSVQSLFGEEELPVGHRRRLIMMSLYDDEPVAASREKDEKSGESETIIDESQTIDIKSVSLSVQPAATTNESITENKWQQQVDIESPASDNSLANADRGDNATDTTDKAVQAIDVQLNTQDQMSEHVLGEVINSDLRTVADTITPARNIAEAAGRDRVDDINKAIGVNDRFLLIRDLFGGRAEAYEDAIRKINGFDNLDDCMVYIVENFEWNPNADGTKLLMELIERKYR